MPTKPKAHNPLPPWLQAKMATARLADQETRRKEYEAQPDRAAERRFYSSTRWVRFAKWFRMQPENVLCVQCKARGLTVATEQVDHIKPRKEYPELAWDVSNLQGLCLECHRAKTVKETMGKESRLARTIIVCGRPGSGKTTYVEGRRQAGDIVWDWDQVAATLLGIGPYDSKEDVAGLAKHMRTALVGWCAVFNKTRTLWLIVSDKRQAELAKEQLRGELVTLDVEAQECRRRIAGRGGDMTSRMKAIDDWKA